MKRAATAVAAAAMAATAVAAVAVVVMVVTVMAADPPAARPQAPPRCPHRRRRWTTSGTSARGYARRASRYRATR